MGRMQKYMRRAVKGLRQDARLHLTATASLAVALLCLATFLLLLTNLQRAFDNWGGRHQVSIYLRDGTSSEDVGRVQSALAQIPEVRTVRFVARGEARRRFLAGYPTGEPIARALTEDLFPTSLEVQVQPSAGRFRLEAITSRIGGLAGVEEVETYRDFFDRLLGLIAAGRWVLLFLGGIVAIAGICIGANTARLTLAGRRDEIEILRLCGATDRFVRVPFLLEGAMEGLIGALAAIAALGLLYLIAREPIGALMPALGGIRPSFLSLGTILALSAGGSALGAVGTHAVLRKPLRAL